MARDFSVVNSCYCILLANNKCRPKIVVLLIKKQQQTLLIPAAQLPFKLRLANYKKRDGSRYPLKDNKC